MSEKSLQEVVYFNACDLCIESFQSKHQEPLYFVWRKGKKFSQSLKYQPSHDIIHPKQVLTLNLKIYYQGSKALERYTHLYLYKGNGIQIGKFKLLINDWTAEYREGTINIGEGVAKVKMRRKMIMKLQHFHKMRSQVQESSDEEGNRFRKKVSRQGGDNQKEEIVRLKKEVEDTDYLATKLKSERNACLVKIQQLQLKLSQIEDKVSKEIKKLREYYGLKIEMRESIYKDQIQQLITSFNKNYEFNRNLMENLIRQKYEYEEEIVHLKQSNQQYIQKQEENYENIIAQMETHKKKVDEELEDSNEKLKQREKTIEEQKEEIAHLTNSLNDAIKKYNELQQEKYNEDARKEKIIEDMETQIADLKNHIQEQQLQIQQIKDQLSNVTSDNGILQKQLSDLHEQNLKVIKEKLDIENKHSITTIELGNANNEIERIMKDMVDFKTNSQIMRQESEKQRMDILDTIEKERKQWHQAEHMMLEERSELEKRITELTQQNLKLGDLHQVAADLNIVKDGDITILRQEVQGLNLMNQQLHEQIRSSNDKYRQEHFASTAQINDLIGRNAQLEIELNGTKAELRDLEFKSKLEIERLKIDYDNMSESNRKLLEDEMQFYKKQKEQDHQHFEDIKNQYEHQIQNMIAAHKEDTQNIQNLFKEEIDQKTKEYLELINKNKEITQLYEGLKLKIEMEKFQRDSKQYIRQKDKDMKAIRKARGLNIEEESSEEEDSQEEIIRKKKRNKNKEIIPVVEEVEEEESEDEEEEIDNIFKKKKKIEEVSKAKPAKRFKRGNKIQQPSIEQSSIVESEQIIQIDDSEQVKRSIERKKKPSIVIQIDQDEKPKKIKKKLTKKETIVIPVQSSFQKVDSEILQQKIESLEEQNNKLKQSQRKYQQKIKKDEQKYRSEIEKYEAQIKRLKAEIKALSEQTDLLVSNLGDKDQQLIIQLNDAKQKRRLEDEKQKQMQNKERQRKQIERLNEQKKKKIQEQNQNMEVQSRKRQKSPSPQKTNKLSPSQKSKQKEERSKSPPKKSDSPRNLTHKFDEDYYLKKIGQMEEVMQSRKDRIQTLEDTNRDLRRNLDRFKHELDEKHMMYESKMMEMEKKDLFKSYYDEQQGLKKSVADFESKLGAEKEKNQEIKFKLENKQKQIQNLLNQNRNLKAQITELRKRPQQVALPKSLREMQSELQQSNRRIMQLSRNYNFAKLERDSFEDEIRILKKKIGETTKASQQWQSKAFQNERQIQQFKRRQNKIKRQGEELIDDNKKLKEMIKKLQEDIAFLNKSQNEYVYERKKVLDQITKLEDVISKNEVENIRLNKEIDKYKTKIVEKEDSKDTKHHQLRTEYEKADTMRLKAQKKSKQYQQTIKNLRDQLEVLEKENKKINDERKQTYGEKLKHYIQEIINIKNILEEFQAENSRLKIQNSQFFEQNEILKMSFSKLQIKYEQLMEQQSKELQQIENLKQTIVKTKEQLTAKTVEWQKLQNIVNLLRKDLDNERVVSKRKTDKIQSYEQVSQRYIYQIKNLKIKLGQFESNVDWNTQMSQKCIEYEKRVDQLQNQIRGLAEQYENYKGKFTYGKQQVEAALRELKLHEQKIKQEQFSKIIQELDTAHNAKRQNMERQLLDLFNQNQRLRLTVQKINDESTEFQLHLAELQPLRDKTKKLQRDNTLMERRFNESNQQIKSVREQLRKTQIKLNESIRNQEGKQTENALLKKKYDDLEARFRQLNESHSQYKQEQRRIMQKYRLGNNQKQEQIDKLMNELQYINNKLLASELQIKRLKQAEVISTSNYSKRVKSLESKIDEINRTFEQHQKVSDQHFKQQIKELKQALQKCQIQLQEKLQRIEELNEGLIMMQNQVDELTQQLTNARSQLSEENELYTIEVNKLRNKMRQTENIYDNNIRILEEQMSAMSKELTTLKYNRQNGSSRMRGSRQSQNDDKANKRYEQKIKIKQRRIEELKDNIIKLEQTVTNLMKKQEGGQQNAEQLQFTRNKLENAQRQLNEVRQRFKNDISKQNQQIKFLKAQISSWKQMEERWTLKMEEKDLQLQLIQTELDGTHKLYIELQKQLDRRKISINNQLSQESTVKINLKKKEIEIQQLISNYEGITSKLKQCEQQLKKKINELKIVNQKLENAERKEEATSAYNKKLIDQCNTLKNLFQQQQNNISSTSNQTKKYRNEINYLLKENEQLKTELNIVKRNLSELMKQLQLNEKKLTQYQLMVTTYLELNEKCFQVHKIPIDQLLIQSVELNRQINLKDEEIASLNEQIEEYKFLEDRKYLDYNDLKKQNYEMTLKLQQYDLRQEQFEQLHQICDELQAEKKHSYFRYDALKLQLESLAKWLKDTRNIEGRQVSNKIEQIVNTNYDIL